MSLKFKRYYPIILSLVGFLTFLVFAMGDQYVISYTLNVESLRVEQLAAIHLDIANDVAQLVSLMQ